MIRILSDIRCSGSSFQADPWVPLSVSWQVDGNRTPMNLFVRGDGGGYVELKVDPESFGLRGMVVVVTPPASQRAIQRVTGARGSAPIVDRTLWDWKITPDYTEPMRRDADTTAALSVSKNLEFIALWFSDDDAVQFLSCEQVVVGVSAEAALVCVSVPIPPVDDPIGYPSKAQS